VIRAQNQPFVIDSDDVKLECSGPPEYTDTNKKKKKTFRLSAIKGVTIHYAAENIGPDPENYYKGACLGLYTEKEHKLVASTFSGKNGIFDFENIPDGNYRLIITTGFTNAANIPIQLEKSKSKSRQKKIMVYLIGNNFAEDSYAKLK